MCGGGGIMSLFGGGAPPAVAPIAQAAPAATPTNDAASAAVLRKPRPQSLLSSYGGAGDAGAISSTAAGAIGKTTLGA